MKIAYCVMAHTDLPHIARLARRLVRSGADVYLHIDSHTDATPLQRELAELLAERRVVLVPTRVHSGWGSWELVAAEITVLRCALAHDTYDRLCLMHGLDYPLRSDAELRCFFEAQPEVEFIRGCNCSRSDDPYFAQKVRCYWLLGARSRLLRKLSNGINRYLHPYVRSGVIHTEGKVLEVYYGSALWGLTGDCARYVLDWYDQHPAFNRWFRNAYAPDELYFQTVIFNSPFRSHTMAGGPEPEKRRLVNWRALHYFEYGRQMKVFTQADLPMLRQQESLFIRKVTTEASTPLLDLLDAQDTCIVAEKDDLEERDMNTRPYQICKCCVMDTSDTDITFDARGVCMRCNEYRQRILPEWNYGEGHEAELKELISVIKKSGTDRPYDCILGFSGGLDSSYLLHLAVREWGLRPFVLHIDCGWNLPVAERNMHRLTDRLGVELHIETMDRNELREMQLAWFRTGLEALDAPQDHAFIALIDRVSRERGIKYILNGYNIATEVISDPAAWNKGAGPTGDGTYMKDVLRRHCTIPIRHYSFTSGFKHKFYLPYVQGIRTVKPLDLLPITRAEMVETLVREYGYEPYGQKHFENLLTKFLKGWWSPTRFGHDIRRAQLSSLVVTGQMTREEALEILAQPPLTEEESHALFTEVARRLEISEDELMQLHALPECSEQFRSQAVLYRLGIRLYERLGLERRIRR